MIRINLLGVWWTLKGAIPDVFSRDGNRPAVVPSRTGETTSRNVSPSANTALRSPKYCGDTVKTMSSLSLSCGGRSPGTLKRFLSSW